MTNPLKWPQPDDLALTEVDGGTATVVVTQVRARRGTAAQWTSADPTLAVGELGLETDTGKMKFGDGATAWTSLAYTRGSLLPTPVGGTNGHVVTVQSNAYVLAAGGGGGSLAPIGVDAPPSSPHADDEEFATTDGFAWHNQGAATVSYENHLVVLIAPGSATHSLRIRDKAITTPSGDWRYRLKCWMSAGLGGNLYGGICLREAATGKILTVWLDGTSNSVRILRWTSATGTSTVVGVGFLVSMAERNVPWIMEVERVGSNMFYRMAPGEGGPSFQLGTEAVTASFTTEPDQIGIVANSASASLTSTLVGAWLRRVA